MKEKTPEHLIDDLLDAQCELRVDDVLCVPGGTDRSAAFIKAKDALLSAFPKEGTATAKDESLLALGAAYGGNLIAIHDLRQATQKGMDAISEAMSAIEQGRQEWPYVIKSLRSANYDLGLQMDRTRDLFPTGGPAKPESKSHPYSAEEMIQIDRINMDTTWVWALFPEPGAGGMLRGRPTCSWDEDSDGTWQTDCGHSFVFDDDGPKENGGKFCFYCGGNLIENAYKDPDDEAIKEGGGT